MSIERVKADIWRTVQDLNRLWTIEDDSDKLAEYFHKNMVAVTPTDRQRLEGREACVAAWKAFSERTRIYSWNEIDPRIDLFGDGAFAVVTYYYEISFDSGGKRLEHGGRDMMCLVLDEERWWVVADQFSSYSS